MRHPLGRARRSLSKEPEGDTYARWYLALGGLFALMAAILLVTQGITELAAYGILIMSLAMAVRWRAESLPAQRRRDIAALRLAQWVLAGVALIVGTFGIYLATLEWISRN